MDGEIVDAKAKRRLEHRAAASQLWKEMWMPGLAAVCWTIGRLYSTPTHRNFVDGIADFGAGFFFCCWIASQWLRVKKQQKVEAGLETIEARLNRSIENFDHKTHEIIGNLTGGDSFCYVILLHESEKAFRGQAVLVVEPEWSLHDLFFTVTSRPSMQLHRRSESFTVEVGVAKSVIGQWVKADFNVEDGRHGCFWIDFYARNGRWRQYLNAVWVNGRRTIATQVERNDKIVYSRIDPDYPKDSNGQVDWDSPEPWLGHNLQQPPNKAGFDR